MRTHHEMAEAIRQANWPPISEFDICLIDLNQLKEALKDGRKSERSSVRSVLPHLHI